MMIPIDPRSSNSNMASLEKNIRGDFNHIIIYNGQFESNKNLRTCEMKDQQIEGFLHEIKGVFLLQVGYVRNAVTAPIFGIDRENDDFKLKFYIAEGMNKQPINSSVIAYDIGLLGEILHYYKIPLISFPHSFLEKYDGLTNTEFDWKSLIEFSKKIKQSST